MPLGADENIRRTFTMPMGYYYGYDYTWYLLVLPAFLLAL